MSDIGSGGQSGGVSSGDATQAGTVAALQQQGTNPQDQATLSDFSSGFLNRVDPAHRTIVEPYLRQIDGGITRRFQELHGQLQPYEALGADPETLSSAYQLYQMIDQDPQQVLALLTELVGGQQQGASGQAPMQMQPGQQQSQGLQGMQSPFGQPGQFPQQGQLPQQQQSPGLPPEIMAQLEQLPMMQQVLEHLAQTTLDQQTQQQQAAEDAQLDQYLGLLKQEYGDFNERFVIAQMMAGMDGEEAVQSYMQEVQGQVNQRSQRPNLPTVLGGGGSVPPETQRIASASRKDVKGLVANILQSSAQG